MNLLFIHQNFPGQWRHLAAHAARAGHGVVAIGQKGVAQPQACPEGVRLVLYEARGAGEQTHKYLRLTEAAVRRGQGVAKAVMALRQRGFVPDVVCVHHGWGEALYLKDVLPDVPVLTYCEFYYHGTGADMGFDPEFPSELDNRLQVRTRNMLHGLSLLDADRGLSPTRWQQSLFPPELRTKIAVVHDGIDTARVRPIRTRASRSATAARPSRPAARSSPMSRATSSPIAASTSSCAHCPRSCAARSRRKSWWSAAIASATAAGQRPAARGAR